MSCAGPHPHALHEHLALQPQVLLHCGALIREGVHADSDLAVASKKHHVAILEVSRLPCTMRLHASHAASCVIQPSTIPLGIHLQHNPSCAVPHLHADS